MSTISVPPFPVVVRLSGRTVRDPGEASLRRLRDIVAGKDLSWPRTHAMALLFESDFPNKHRDYESVLTDENEASEIRHMAALYLGMMNTCASREILIEQTHLREEYVLEGVLKALGSIGNADALAAIERAQQTAKGQAAVQARLAAAFIAYRLGLPGHELPIPSEDEYVEPLTSCARPVRTIRADATDIEVCLRSLAHQSFGVELIESPMYQIRCERNIWMLAFNRDFACAGAVRALTARKTCLGIVARRNPSSGLYATAYVVLTAPAPHAKDKVDLLVHRADGDLTCGGQAHVAGDRAKFSVRSVSRPRAFAIQIEGMLEDGRLEVTTAWTSPTGQKLEPVELRRDAEPSDQATT